MGADKHLDEEAVDGFTWRDIFAMVLCDTVTAVCEHCGCEYRVEPDAENYDCHAGCGSTGCVTSPIRKVGWI